MAKRNNPQNVINSYKRRQKMTPIIVGVLAGLLVLAGIVILIVTIQPNLFAPPKPTDTPTLPPPTATVAPSATQVPPTASNTATLAPTNTLAPTVTQTPTGPFEYKVVEKDNCWDIAAKFKVDVNTLLQLNNFPVGQCPINVGQTIMIPAPGQTAPTATPVDPSKFAVGALYEYTIQSGDTLRGIAIMFNSTQKAIIDQNKLTDPNKLEAGKKLIIPVNIATPVPTTTDTPTPKPGTPSATAKPTNTPSATPTK